MRNLYLLILSVIEKSILRKCTNEKVPYHSYNAYKQTELTAKTVDEERKKNRFFIEQQAIRN